MGVYRRFQSNSFEVPDVQLTAERVEWNTRNMGVENVLIAKRNLQRYTNVYFQN